MKAVRLLVVALCSTVSASPALADIFGSVEPIASDSVLDILPLSDQDLDIRTAFAERLLQCGVVDDAIRRTSTPYRFRKAAGPSTNA